MNCFGIDNPLIRMVLFNAQRDDQEFSRKFLQQHGVLPKGALCPKCNKPCRQLLVLQNYYRGRRLRKSHHWVFGGIERGSGKRFVICLGMGGKRDRETLEPLIVRHILPGTTVISDCWRAYSNIPSLVDSNGQPLNYIHRTVNHAVGFVNSRNPWIHTQTIERLWGGS